MINRKILLTGFTPFDGRNHNASWIAASALAATPQDDLTLRAELIPVCWGAPRQVLLPVLNSWQPQHIVGMGEGEPHVFRIETRACNVRKERADNDNRFPESVFTEKDGPHVRMASADCDSLLKTLTAEGFPVRLSSDAGAFLCEELLYTIEGFRTEYPFLESVIFIHLPPFGTELIHKGTLRSCDEPLLLDFGQSLLRSLFGRH